MSSVFVPIKNAWDGTGDFGDNWLRLPTARTSCKSSLCDGGSYLNMIGLRLGLDGQARKQPATSKRVRGACPGCGLLFSDFTKGLHNV
jgi:hypothetical protein